MNDARTDLLLLLLLGLLTVIAFSSGTEVAMLSVNRYRLRHRANSGQRAARMLEKLLQRPDDWLGVNLVILAAASVFASQSATILAQHFGDVVLGDAAPPAQGVHGAAEPRCQAVKH